MFNWMLAQLKFLLMGDRDVELKRSPKWSAFRKQWLEKHPYCAACGGKKKVTPHHKIPVSVDPSLELSEDNLISLCEYHWCHLRVGHRYNWRKYNPNVEVDADRERVAYDPWLL